MAAFERILVTGGAGFVGGHLCAALAEAYPQAHAVDAAASRRTRRP